MNKKGVAVKVVFIIVIIVLFKLSFVVNSSIVKDGYVVSVEDKLITVEDIQGKEWQYITNKKFTVNDKVSIVIDNNNTEDDENDDIVKRIKKIK